RPARRSSGPRRSPWSGSLGPGRLHPWGCVRPVGALVTMAGRVRRRDARPRPTEEATMPDQSTGVAAGSHPADGAAAMGTGRGCASELLEAGMDGDLDSWQEGLALACGVELGDGDRRRLALVGGPPPVALEQV